MIRITADEETLSIRAEGHAEYAEKGNDIVCAAVSILLYSYAAELLRSGAKADIRDEGEFFEIVPEERGEHEKTAYRTVMSGLRMLADSYENYVMIREG